MGLQPSRPPPPVRTYLDRNLGGRKDWRHLQYARHLIVRYLSALSAFKAPVFILRLDADWKVHVVALVQLLLFRYGKYGAMVAEEH